jgi:membrane protease YdiL (CAAX protease family)
MNRLIHRMRAHPVCAYFSAAYLFSWPFFLLVMVVLPRTPAYQTILGSLAVFSPAFASMMVAAVVEPQRIRGQPVAQWATFFAAWILAGTTLILFALNLRSTPVSPQLLFFGGTLGLLPAFFASRAFSRTLGVRRHFRSLVVPRGNLLWYLVALLAFPAVQLAGVGITALFGSRMGVERELDISIDPSAAVLLFLYGFFFAGGINEESGWRGFALPRLQARYSPLVAASVVWFFWALWHLPIDLISGDSISSILVNRLFYNAMWSVLFMWVFNRTRGSVLAPAIFHPAMNTSGSLLPGTNAATALFAALVLTAILSDRMWRRLPETHPAVIR